MTEHGIIDRASGKEPSRTIVKELVLLTIFVFLSFSMGGPSLSYGKEPLSISGITEPIGDVTLSATIIGTISTIFIKEGMPVKKGEVILDLDKKVDDLEVERRKLIWENKSEVKAAAARVSTLKSMLDSTRELFNSTGSVSREDLEKLQLEYEVALSEKERLESAEERERIEYEMSRETAYKRSVRSPIQGTVIKLFLDEGESCQENQPLVHVVDTSRGLFVSNVEEWIGRTLKKGQTVDLKIKTGNESTTKLGTVIFVSPVVDPASGLLEVKAEFDNSDGSVRPGISGSLLLRPR
jgi:membrane fusion protein, multidrug efflux system